MPLRKVTIFGSMSSPAFAYRYVPLLGKEPSQCLSKEMVASLEAQGKVRRFKDLCQTLGIFLEEAANREFEVIRDHDALFTRIAEISLLPTEEGSARLREMLSYDYFKHFESPTV